MQKDFIDIYKNIEKNKKLNFLKELLLKDSDLQNQFIEFTKKGDLDAIAGINIDDLRDEIWNEISAIDIEKKLGCSGYYDYYDDEGELGNEILEATFDPYVKKSLSFIEKGNYIDAFRIILAIYELSLVEAPEIEDEYSILEDIESYIESVILSSLFSFNSKIAQKVLSVDIVNLLIELFFERYAKYEEYYIAYFNSFFESIISKPENANHLLNKMVHNSYSAITLLHIADVIDDNELYIKVGNEFFLDNELVALKLQKRYKKLNQQSELARISEMLLDRENNINYALFVIENIDTKAYEALYINALQIYITSNRSFKHYELLREYFNEDERLDFIKKFAKGYNRIFYIELLNREKQYETILDFVRKNGDDYHLKELVLPIISIYPNEVFQIIKNRSDKLVDERGRKAYASASKLLQVMLNVLEIKEELKEYVKSLYNHQPKLPALRDELNKAGLL